MMNKPKKEKKVVPEGMADVGQAHEQISEE